METTIKELDAKILELKNLRYNLEKEEIALFKQEAKKNVGRCFLINNCKYVKVVDIPQEEYSVTRTIFNRCQYPALFLTNDSYEPFEYDTLFSAAWGEGKEIRNVKYKEISKEEFNKEFERVLQEFKERILE